MISIIICSRKTEDFEKVRQNIAETIGQKHEVIRIDNSANTYSISQAYNEGARKSLFPILCFVHEDIFFATQDWGLPLVQLLGNAAIGLVGVAGGIYKTKATGPTWWSPLKGAARINLIQHVASGGKKHMYENPFQEKYSQVAALDGVFLACRKEVWEQFPLDERIIRGFHFYDLDLSLSVGEKYQVVVTYDILLEHFSEGKNDKVWAEQAHVVSKKWKHGLPRHSLPLSKNELEEVEKQMMDFYLGLLFQLKVSPMLVILYVWARIRKYPFDKGNIYYLKRWIGERFS
jgi:hypothetical protein